MDPMTMERFCELYAITGSSEPVDPPDPGSFRDVWPEGSTHWRVTLRRGADGPSLAVPYSMGPAHTAEPDPLDVLDAVAMDSAGIENAADLWDWAEEYGYGCASADEGRRLERTYQACVKLRDELRDWIGAEAFEVLLWQTERQ